MHWEKKMVEGINALFDPSDSKLELEKTGKKIKNSRDIYIYRTRSIPK
jgi:hypothetical protein